MSQTIILSNSSIHNIMPTSPDPTPLRMLAFSVAEAALSSDPNSPLFLGQQKVASGPRFMDQNGDWEEAFQAGWSVWNGGVKTAPAPRTNGVWEVLEKAKERKERKNTSTSPVTPSSYNFILPPTSQLAASIARQQETICKPTRPFTKRPMSLYETQSAEPSPTRSTFSTLDQTLPPPEFVPRLSAEDFVQQARKVSADVAAVRERRRSTIEPLSAAKLAEHNTPVKSARRSRLPSLQQIQARVTVTSRLRRSGSVEVLPSIRPSSPRTYSTDSMESVVIQTPADELPNPLVSRRLALQRIMEKRPATPPSPPAEARLSSFLRERTNGRLASGSKVAMVTPDKTTKPILRVTPPSLENRPAVPPLHLVNQITPTKSTFPFRSGFSTPTETRFSHPFTHLSTPPRSGSPTSPTTSYHSNKSGSTGAYPSPTFSAAPIITCTPAEVDEQDSDDGSSASGEFTICDPDAELRAQEEQQAQVMMERGVKGMAMRLALSRRRASDSE